MPKVLSDRTAARLLHLLNQHEAPGTARHGGRGGQHWVFVRCTSATAVGGDDVLDQCYPAVLLFPAADYPAPPEEGEFGCLLTVLGDDGEATTPVEGGVYGGLMTGEVESDRAGSGSSLISGRPRVFATSAPLGDIPSEQSTISTAEYEITSDITWEDTSGDLFTLTLPGDGTYLLCGTIRIYGQATATNAEAAIFVRAYDEEAAEVVPGTTGAVWRHLNSGTASDELVGAHAFAVRYVVDDGQPHTIRWEAYRTAGVTWVTAVVGHRAGAFGDTDGATAPLAYVKLSDVAGGTGPAGPPGEQGEQGPEGDPGANAPDDANAVVGARVFSE